MTDTRELKVKKKREPWTVLTFLLLLTFILAYGVTLVTGVISNSANILHSKEGTIVMELNQSYNVIEIEPGSYEVQVPNGDLNDILVVIHTDGERNEDLENNTYSYVYGVGVIGEGRKYKFKLKHNGDYINLTFKGDIQ